jgi:hypothetical protein
MTTINSLPFSLIAIPRFSASEYAGRATQITRDPARDRYAAIALPIAPAPKITYLLGFPMLIASDNIALPGIADKANRGRSR